MPDLQTDTGNFDAADEQSEIIDGYNVDIHVADAGSFSGTVGVYRYMVGTAVLVASFDQDDLPYDRVVENGNKTGVFLKCIARAAGSVNYYMVGG